MKNEKQQQKNTIPLSPNKMPCRFSRYILCQGDEGQHRAACCWRREVLKEKALHSLRWNNQTKPASLGSRSDLFQRQYWKDISQTLKAHMGFPERVDTTLNWSNLKYCTAPIDSASTESKCPHVIYDIKRNNKHKISFVASNFIKSTLLRSF